MMKIRTVSILLLSGALALPIHAADYYVSSIRAGRSDSNAGTDPDAPWATINKVVSMWGSLSPGDTVHLERGSRWNLSFSSDFFNIRYGGSASGGPITLRGDDYGTGNKPILKRTGGSGGCAFILITGSYITVRDIELDGGHSDYGKNTSGMLILADGKDVSNAQILNMKMHNLGGNTTTYTCGIWLASWTQNTTTDCLIEGNEVSDYAAHGLNHYSQGRMINIIWRNNYVHNNFSGGRYPSANAALQITSGGSGCVFEYNWLEDTTSTEGCILGFGKYADDTGFNAIRFNVITGAGTYGALFTVDYSNMKLLYDIYGNIFMNNGRSGFAMHPYNSYASGTRFNIYNNTFYNNATGGDGSRSEMEIDSACNNTTIDFANNLMVHKNTANTGLAIDSGFSGTFSHRNNLYWHEGGTSQSIVSAYGQNYTVSSVSDFESTAQNEDPRLSDTSQLPVSISSETGPVPGGLVPQENSPAIAAGAQLGSAYALDILQNTRTVPWSIGAYQFSGSIQEDAVPPTVSLTAPSDDDTVSGSSVTVSADASDDIGVAGVQFLLNGVHLGGEDLASPYSIVWDSTAVSNGIYTLSAIVRDAAGNTAVADGVTVTVDNIEIPGDAIISEAGTWQNQSFAAETGLFEVVFAAVPETSPIDCVTGLAQGPASEYDDLAVIVRFNPSGELDARNGDVYMADTPVSYVEGSSYLFRVPVDVQTHTYSVYVRVDDGPEILLADQYAFRTPQNAVTSLDTIALTAAAGSHIVFNFAENQVSVAIPMPPTGLRIREN